MKRFSGKQILAIASAVFSLAAALGSTVLTPEQREALLAFLSTVIAVFGV